jgi:hypothetical protein
MDPQHNPGNPRDDHDNDQDSVVIPLPRFVPDNDIEDLPKTGFDQQAWWYYQGRKRGGDRRYSGHVNRIHGAEAERLRGELADVICDLLDWTARQSDDQSTEDGEAA